MSTEQPIPDDAEAWRPLQSPEERDALVLEFQRLAARLVQAQAHRACHLDAPDADSIHRERRTHR
jgi:hypothetical protein